MQRRGKVEGERQFDDLIMFDASERAGGVFGMPERVAGTVYVPVLIRGITVMQIRRRSCKGMEY